MAHQQSAFQRATLFERSIMDTMTSLVLHNVFGRHPDLQVICVENGSAWSRTSCGSWTTPPAPVSSASGSAAASTTCPARSSSGTCRSRPSTTTTSGASSSLLGADRVLLGSDYPHPEGYPVPAQMLGGIRLSDAERTAIAHNNAARLLHLPLTVDLAEPSGAR